MMRTLPIAACLLLAPAAGALAVAEVPSRGDVAEIESGLALLGDMQVVGIGDSAAMNRAARVRIRKLACAPSGKNSARCTYDADRCLAGEHDAGSGWCRRTAQFVRVTPSSITPGISRRGWAVVRPSLATSSD